MFQIKWTRKALLSFADILRYWNVHNSSETYSRKLISEVEKKEKLISQNPYIGSPSEIKGVKYVLIDKNFSLYYRIHEEVVEVLAFWDNRRNPENIRL
ncbi:plasmid stabilization system protein ParE [Chryseobacterium ginsenosidimutans]|jgi:plasmid stabilization system protein ParE|uniref:type II toxin-antitoxin system RelE/ParE family toxin n=1 Tax=Chryseobacterium ginsenosidimutans TaxID=687846 RepID=UPI002169AFFB|nr:type II toxin-antitoxin system RelE/ParE family toxin [Chryseobacterium ginsenosidimutans]MCS3871135.1 plasmid stabilization system protein ParE [Chryseobacterium ginsenosidimutans]